jgi:hypothetical protein
MNLALSVALGIVIAAVVLLLLWGRFMGVAQAIEDRGFARYQKDREK